jgi:hypothetical protein
MIEVEHFADRGLLLLRLSDRLTEADYDRAVPEIENALDLAGGPLRVMVRLEDFHGWTAGAFRSELRFEFRHAADIDRVAVVGETEAEERAARIAAPFAPTEMRYFPRSEEGSAWEWLGASPHAGTGS